jgi:hypothetical protein
MGRDQSHKLWRGARPPAEASMLPPEPIADR